MTDNFQEWTATSPGVLALANTQYQIKHELVGGTWYFNVFWRGECVRPGHHELRSAKEAAIAHLNDMLAMGYEP